MSKQLLKQITLEHLNAVLETLDELHTATSEQGVEAGTGLTRQELMSFLREIQYIAQETMKEARASARPTSRLRIVGRSERAG